VRRDDGSIVVVALETGPPSPRHEQNLALLLAAAQHLFPGAIVNARTLYCNS
jgi:hypothetical protein